VPVAQNSRSRSGTWLGVYPHWKAIAGRDNLAPGRRISGKRHGPDRSSGQIPLLPGCGMARSGLGRQVLLEQRADVRALQERLGPSLRLLTPPEPPGARS